VVGVWLWLWWCWWVGRLVVVDGWMGGWMPVLVGGEGGCGLSVYQSVSLSVSLSVLSVYGGAHHVYMSIQCRHASIDPRTYHEAVLDDIDAPDAVLPGQLWFVW
jgi:hypothetical protein